MLGFIKKMFIGLLSVCTTGNFGESLASNSRGRLNNNQQCQAWPAIVNANSNKTLLYPFTVSINKCRGSCNTIDDPYTQIRVSNKIKNVNIKVFNFTSVVNGARFLVQHESCECKCWLNESVCNSKQKWNYDECTCECKKLEDLRSCKNDYMMNPFTCDCKCNKAYKIDEYLDIKYFPCTEMSLWCISITMWRWNAKYNWNLTWW